MLRLGVGSGRFFFLKKPILLCSTAFQIALFLLPILLNLKNKQTNITIIVLHHDWSSYVIL